MEDVIPKLTLFDLECSSKHDQGLVIDISIRKIIGLEMEYFAAIIVALENNLSFALRSLLNWIDPFGNSEIHVDLFILFVLPKLPSPNEITNILFRTNLRNRSSGVEISKSGKIGTFRIISILDYMKFFFVASSRIRFLWIV